MESFDYLVELPELDGHELATPALLARIGMRLADVDTARPVLIIASKHVFHGQHQTIVGTAVLAQRRPPVAAVVAPSPVVALTSRKIVFKLVAGSVAGILALCANAAAEGIS